MSRKQEVATLMASEGDYEKKISVLKKAIIVVTKQKQAVEEENSKLREKVAFMGSELSEQQDLNSKLQQRLQALDAELATQKKKTSLGAGLPFGMSASWKGLSSLVTGQGEGVAGNGGPAPLKLSAEDQEKLIQENQGLHMQLFDVKSQLDKLVKSTQELTKDTDAKRCGLERELTDSRAVVEQLTGTVDQLHADTVHYRAISRFCQHFFVLDASTPNNVQLAVSDAALRKRGGTLPTEVREYATQDHVKSTFGTIRNTLQCVSVLLVALRDSVPRDVSGVASQLRWTVDRLKSLIETHDVQKEHLSRAMQAVEGFLRTHPQAGVAPQAAHQQRQSLNGSVSEKEGAVTPVVGYAQTQAALLTTFADWILFMKQSVPFLVQCCLKTSSRRAGAKRDVDSGEEVVSRSSRARADKTDDTAMSSTIARFVWLLSALHGIVQFVMLLCDNASATISQHDGNAHEWVAALQLFFWDGWVNGVVGVPRRVRGNMDSSSASSLSLSDCVGKVYTALLALSSSTSSDPARVALTQLAKVLKSCSGGGGGEGGERRLNHSSVAARSSRGAKCEQSEIESQQQHSVSSTDDFLLRLSKSTAHTLAERDALSRSAGTADIDTAEILQYNLMSSLLAADRSAVLYHTQMNYALLELVRKESEVFDLQNENSRYDWLMRQQSDDTEKMRDALETQIQVLSEQLVEANYARDDIE